MTRPTARLQRAIRTLEAEKEAQRLRVTVHFLQGLLASAVSAAGGALDIGVDEDHPGLSIDTDEEHRVVVLRTVGAPEAKAG